MGFVSGYQSDRSHMPSAGNRTLGPVPAVFNKLLTSADIRINGGRPWDIVVRDPGVYRRVVLAKRIWMDCGNANVWMRCLRAC
jgi:hypothetical protein